MTARELAVALLALPEAMLDLPVFSIADYEQVNGVSSEIYEDRTGEKFVEIS